MMKSTAFLVDMYELTMIQAALESGVAHKKATFELFARKLPRGRRYGVVAGVSRAIEAVENFVFTDEQISMLEQKPVFNKETIDFLRDYKFAGNIFGYRDGELYFPYSPILTVEGTFADAVILETVLLSILNHDSAVASAASRMVMASEGSFPLIEMGSRRTHEESAVAAALAAYVTGFNATSNMEAGLKYGVPTTGTAAHAFTLAHADEMEAFRAQVKALGVNTTLLVDTYAIEQGIRNAVAAAGPELGAIRIDSGDLHEEPTNARRLLDSLGATNTKIVVSSDIDEYSIAEIVERGTPVDGVGAGTRVVTGSGHPTAGMVFKLVEIEDEEKYETNDMPDGSTRLATRPFMRPVAKKASGKKSVGGLKRAYRTYDEAGKITGEFYTIGGTRPADGLQVDYIKKGEMLPLPTLAEAREHHQAAMATLPEAEKTVVAGAAAFEAAEATVEEID